MTPETEQEDLTAAPVMDLVNRLADPNTPHAAIDSGRNVTFQFTSSSSPGSPLAKELERRGIEVVPDVESLESFVMFRVVAREDQLREQDVNAILEQMQIRADAAMSAGSMTSSPQEPEILDPRASC